VDQRPLHTHVDKIVSEPRPESGPRPDTKAFDLDGIAIVNAELQ
jgi:hypothetical protein